LNKKKFKSQKIKIAESSLRDDDFINFASCSLIFEFQGCAHIRICISL
jgi:hypothetical protein